MLAKEAMEEVLEEMGSIEELMVEVELHLEETMELAKETVEEVLEEMQEMEMDSMQELMV